MKIQKLFIIWDEKDGYITNKVYLDKKSAEIAISVLYTDYWINNKKVKVEELEGVSYV